VTKASGELLAQHLAGLWNVPLVVVRPSLVYGPGDLHLLGWFRSIARGYYRVVGTGQNLVHPVYIDDVVAGLWRCAEDPRARGHVYHLVGQRPLPLSALAARIAEAAGRRLPRLHIPLPVARGLAAALVAIPGVAPARLPLTPSRVRFMIESRVYSGARIAEHLNYAPQVEVAAGLQRTIDWYRSEGLL
jgi:dihydroflavonol-4-reductase